MDQHQQAGQILRYMTEAGLTPADQAAVSAALVQRVMTSGWDLDDTTWIPVTKSICDHFRDGMIESPPLKTA